MGRELPDETELPDGTELPDENGQRGETCLQSVWGNFVFPEPYEEVDVVGQRKSLAFTPVMLLGQVSP